MSRIVLDKSRAYGDAEETCKYRVGLLERRTGTELGSASAVDDSKQTLVCSYLSAAVLIGLLLNTLLG
jgi:hypothetical protein